MELTFTLTVDRAHAFPKLNAAWLTVDKDRSGKLDFDEMDSAEWSSADLSWSQTVKITGKKPRGLIYAWNATTLNDATVTVKVSDADGTLSEYTLDKQPTPFLIQLVVL